MRVVAREGFDGVTFRSVAAEAGVTHGLASYHFGTREEMIHAALAWATRNALRDSGMDREQGIEEFASELPELMAQRPQDAVFQYQLALEALKRPELLHDVRQSYSSYISAVGESLTRDGIDHDPATAALVFAMLDGITLQHLIYGDTDRTEDMLARMRKILKNLATDPHE